MLPPTGIDPEEASPGQRAEVRRSESPIPQTGVDLTTAIDGVDSYTGLKVVSEVEVDMSRWPTAKHFASWLGLSPNNRVSGGRVMSSRTTPNANRAATAL